MHAKLKSFSAEKFAVHGYDFWICGGFLHIVP
jgi:hypothetical protein